MHLDFTMAMSDIIDLCKTFGVNPLQAAWSEVSTTVMKEQGFADDLAKHLDAKQVFLTYKCDGSQSERILVSFEATTFCKLLGDQKRYEFQFNDTKVCLHNIATLFGEPEVQKTTSKEEKVKKFLRKIKPFSGRDRPAGGECCVSEWLVLAQDIVDNARDYSALEKIDYLRNTLVGFALQLFTSTTSEIDTPQDVIDLIARTYGGSVSLDQLFFEFHQITQNNKEKPSVLWARLQTKLLEIQKTFKCDEVDKKRFIQFKWGLCPADHDILATRLDFEIIVQTGDFPHYANFLKDLQCFERERAERNSRSVKSKVTSALVSTQSEQEVCELKHEVDSLKCKVETPSVGLVAGLSVNSKSKYSSGKKSKDTHCSSEKKTHKKSLKFLGECWNCEEIGHRFPQCTKPFNAESVAKHFAEHKAKLEAKKSFQKKSEN